MSSLKLLVTLGLFSLSHLSFAAACPASSAVATEGNGSCTVTDGSTGTTVVLNFNSGFDSSTLIENDTLGAVGTDTWLSTSVAATVAANAAAQSKASGNNGNTIGAQRKLSFIKAAEIVASKIVTTVPLVIEADFEALSCSQGGGILGSAGATTNRAKASPPAGMAANTFYPIGLINSYLGSDDDGALSDISASYNMNIGGFSCVVSTNGWYYGYDAPPSTHYAGYLDGNGDPLHIDHTGFTTVLLHEIAHGLGFASLVDKYTGVKPSGLNDIYSTFLYDQNNGSWPSLSNAQRANNGISGTALLWNGSNVNTAAIGLLSAGFHDADSSSTFTSGDRVQMYAPNPVESGSSLSHFNIAASPNEIMEPKYTAGSLDLGLALHLFKDIGWSVVTGSNTAPTLNAIGAQSTNEDTVKNITLGGSDAETASGSLIYSVTSCPTNISCNVSGTSLTLTPDSNYNGASNSVTVQVSDGSLTDDETFNLNVTAVNDAPTISGIPNQNVVDGSFVDISLTGYANDIDGDSLSYSDTACGANLTCSFPNTSTLRVAASGGVGNTVTVTIQVQDDGTGNLTDTDSFDVTISSSTPSTTVNNGGGEINNGGSITFGLGTEQVNVNNGSGSYTYALDYNSTDVTGLVTANGSGLTIGLPSSGEFAGDYTLTITDNGDGDVINITITRPLRLVWSATSLLNGKTDQTLKVEGGAAGTIYSLSQAGDSDILARDSGGAANASAIAANDANSFNAGVFYLDTHPVGSISNTNVTITNDASYDNATTNGIKVYPSTSHTITVEDSAGNALANASGNLNGGESLLTELNLGLSFNADANGQFTALLPDTGVLPAGQDSFAMQVSANGYNPENITLDSTLTAQTVTLTEMVSAVVISGEITALGDQNFQTNPPSVNVSLDDGSQQSANVTVASPQKAQYTYTVDLSQNGLGSLSVSQQNSVSFSLNISNVQEDFTYNVGLDRNIAIVSAQPSTAPPVGIGGSGGGSLPWYLLLLSVPLVYRKPFK